MKNKNIMRSVITILFLILLFVFIYSAETTTFANAFIKDVPLAIKIVLPQIYFLYNAVTNASMLWFLAFVVINLSFATISIIVVSISYRKINSALYTYLKSKNKGKIYYKKTKVIFSLVKKEAKTFFSTPIYLMNGIMGPVLVTIMAVMLANGIWKISGEGLNIYAIISMTLLTLPIGLVPTTAVSISIEGDKFYTLKSLPI